MMMMILMPMKMILRMFLREKPVRNLLKQRLLREEWKCKKRMEPSDEA